jgi:arylsulfatase
VEWNTSHRSGSNTELTLPGAMSPLGYRTGAFSANTFFFSREHGFGRDFLHFDDFYHSLADMMWRTAYGGIATKYLRPALGLEDLPARKRAPDVNAEVLRWVDRDPTRPFLAFLNYLDTHDPYLPPEPYRSRYSGKPGTGGLLNSKLHVPDEISPEELQGEIDAYDAGITFVDDHIDQLLKALAARQRKRDLLVIVTSDHGEEFLEHKGFFHGRHLYREVIQVPLIIWQPSRVPAGVRVDRPVTNTSVPATIMSLLGQPRAEFKLPSLQTLWQKPDMDWPLPVIEIKHQPWQDDRTEVHHGTLRSVVDPRWHYIELGGQPAGLFEWMIDPREQVNLVNRADLAAVVESLKPYVR